MFGIKTKKDKKIEKLEKLVCDLIVANSLDNKNNIEIFEEKRHIKQFKSTYVVSNEWEKPPYEYIEKVLLSHLMHNLKDIIDITEETNCAGKKYTAVINVVYKRRDTNES